MSKASNWIFMIHSCMTLLGAILAFVPSVNATGGWEPFSPRPEISPDFQFLKKGGQMGKEVG